MLRRLLLLLIILLVSCRNEYDNKWIEKYYTQVEKDFSKLPIQNRIKKWDSILNQPSLSEMEKAYVYFFKSRDLAYLSKDNDAIAYNEKALEIFQKYNNSLMVAKAHINIGISYAFTNRKATAMDHLIKGLNIANEFKNKKLISRVYSEFSHIYYSYGDKKQALEYLKKTILIQKELNDSIGLSATYLNSAIIEQELGEIEKAYHFALKAVTIDTLMNNEVYLVNSYRTLGKILFLLKKDTLQAFKYYDKALKLANEIDSNNSFIYEDKSDVFSQIKQIDSAIYYIKEAIAAGSENISDNIRFYKKMTYLELTKKNDLEILKLVKIKDSLVDYSEKLKQEEDKKNIERTVTLSNKQKQLVQVKQINKKNRIIFIFVILTFILGILISYQLNHFDKLKYKQEKYILEQKVLRSQMNPHFIFNVLTSIQNSLIQNNPIVSATYLSKFAQLIRANFDHVKKSCISLKDELKVLINYLETQKFRYKDKFDYIIDIDEKINQEKMMVPPMILQPFVENAIEHGFKNISYKGELKVKIYTQQNKICFEILDNGSGYFPKKNKEEHALDIFKRRLELMGKEVLNSYHIKNLEHGTKVVFCIPVKTL